MNSERESGFSQVRGSEDIETHRKPPQCRRKVMTSGKTANALPKKPITSSWFVVAFNLVDCLAANTEVLIRQFLNGDSEELFRDMGIREAFCFAKNLGGCCCQTLNKLFFLFCCQLSALD